MSSSVDTFGELGLNDQLLEACKRLNWVKPTDIQAATIPPSLKGRNLIGLAETGSGKTAAYALPILQELMISPKHYFALILAPTRELASQVQTQFVSLGKSIGLNTILLVGGSPIVEQANLMIAKPPHILIATPGRFIDHLKRTKGFDEIKLQNLQFLVIDEADRMLGSDFESVIEKILIVLPPKRQTFLFSATMTEKVGKLQRASLRDPVRISTRKSKFQTVAGLNQYIQLVPQAELETYLVYLLRSAFLPPTLPTAIAGLDAIRLSHEEAVKAEGDELESREEAIGSAIVFTRTRDTSNKLSLLLRQFLTVPVITLNGDMPQAQRLGALAKFKRVPMSVLVATDVASRGLDIPHVGLVVNYDVPLDAKTYMHRVGRTARAGRQGAALTLLTQFSVVFYLTEIEKHLVTTEGSNQEKVPALVVANTPAETALDAAVGELHHEVMTAMALAGKTIAGIQRKAKGGGRAGSAFLAVDDHPAPSTAEIAVPTGTKRTGWGSEAPEALKLDIATVLAATSVKPGVAEGENALVEASKRMSRLKNKRKGRGDSSLSRVGQGFKRAYLRREANARDDNKGGNAAASPSAKRGHCSRGRSRGGGGGKGRVGKRSRF